MRLLISLVILMLLLISVTGYTYNEISAPAASFTISNTTTVNVSGAVNISAFPFLNICHNASAICANITNHVINVTILNKSSSSGNYSILASSFSLTLPASNTSGFTGDDFWNFTATFAQGYNWIRLNFTNVSQDSKGAVTGSLSEERIINVDTDLYLIKIPTHNMSFVTKDGTTSCCGVSNANVWGCVAC